LCTNAFLQAASSSLQELGPGSKFQPVLTDNVPNAERVVILSGKLYYELAKERAARGLEDRVALVRIEELCPFPFSEARDALAQFGQAKELFWLQEEPRNQGAWTHVESRLRSVTEKPVAYKGRKESAIPAPGVGKVYKAEQQALIESAFAGL
jgi:probable 2-oxoglutarate dehydrogenase E1 component DHKTD1